MLKRFVAYACLAFAVFLLWGCAGQSAIPNVPSKLDHQGLVVARIYLLGLQAMENASLVIDGRVVNDAMRNGYVAVPLYPGDHTITEFRITGRMFAAGPTEQTSPYRTVKGGGGRAPVYIYVPGSSYTVYYSTLAINRSFHIEAGKVTNLGLVIYVPWADKQPDFTTAKPQHFNVFNLDNSAEINTFLDTNYPQMVKSLVDRNISLAPSKYLDQSMLPQLRQLIAQFEARGKNVVKTANKSFVFGRAGTIGVGDIQTQSDLQYFQILDTGTLSDIMGGAQIDNKPVFLTSEGNLLQWQDGRLNASRIPWPVQPLRMVRVGKGLMVVDAHMRILSKSSLNAEWSNDESVMTNGTRSDVLVVAEEHGAYLAVGPLGFPSMIYHFSPGSPKLERVPNPPKEIAGAAKLVHWLVAADNGLFVVPNTRQYYFWSKAAQQWQILSKPNDICLALSIDQTGENLKIKCGEIDYTSSDGGASWDAQDI